MIGLFISRKLAVANLHSFFYNKIQSIAIFTKLLFLPFDMSTSRFKQYVTEAASNLTTTARKPQYGRHEPCFVSVKLP